MSCCSASRVGCMLSSVCWFIYIFYTLWGSTQAINRFHCLHLLFPLDNTEKASFKGFLLHVIGQQGHTGSERMLWRTGWTMTHLHLCDNISGSWQPQLRALLPLSCRTMGHGWSRQVWGYCSFHCGQKFKTKLIYQPLTSVMCLLSKHKTWEKKKQMFNCGM